MTRARDPGPAAPTRTPRLRPTTAAGRWAGRVCLCALGAFAAAVLLSVLVGDDEGGDLADAARAVVTATFWGGGLGALVLAVRARALGDRSRVVTAVLILGVVAALLLVAEIVLPE